MAFEPGLYVAATPIGNLGDITLRVIETLKKADLILCEDTRMSARLCKAYDIRTPLKAYHDHNGDQMRPFILERLAGGEKIVLVSDAGTPLISDPGYKLVRAVRDAGHHVYTLPGACAVTAALSIAGAPTDRFMFAGFVPAKEGGRRSFLEDVQSIPSTLVFYETGPRLRATLTAMADIFGPRSAAIARELTKLYEEVREGPLPDLVTHYAEAGAPKGEIVLIVHPPEEVAPQAGDIDTLLRTLLTENSVKDAARDAATQTGLPRKELYTKALALKAETT